MVANLIAHAYTKARCDDQIHMYTEGNTLTRRRLFFVLSLAALLLVSLPAASMADQGQIFTATVTLVGMGLDEAGTVLMTMGLPDGETVAEVAGHCQFFDSEGNAISAYVFSRRYQGRVITVDFTEVGADWFRIEEARGGSI